MEPNGKRKALWRRIKREERLGDGELRETNGRGGTQEGEKRETKLKDKRP